jgi:hypothetical protein
VPRNRRPRPSQASRVHEVRGGAHGAGGLALQVGVPAGRPEEHDRADPRAGRKAPAFEAVRNRRVRYRNRHGQDEREDRSGRCRREVAAQHAGEQGDEADDCHRTRGEPRVSRAERSQRDEDGADERKPDICGEPLPRRASKLDQHEDREGSEGRVDRRLRLLDHLVREREDRRDHDRRARGALQRCEVRHGCRSYVGRLRANFDPTLEKTLSGAVAGR